MMTLEHKKLKEQVLEKLGKLKMKQSEVDDIIAQIEGKVEEMNGEKPLEQKPLKTGYGTSCLRLEEKGKLVTEY